MYDHLLPRLISIFLGLGGLTLCILVIYDMIKVLRQQKEIIRIHEARQSLYDEISQYKGEHPETFEGLFPTLTKPWVPRLPKGKGKAAQALKASKRKKK